MELDDDPAALAGADEGVGAVVGVHDHEREGSHQTWNGDSFDQMILDILDLFETLNPHKLEQKVYFIISWAAVSGLPSSSFLFSYSTGGLLSSRRERMETEKFHFNRLHTEEEERGIR